MRDGNPGRWRPAEHDLLVFSLPMRDGNWNPESVRGNPESAVFSLPMRDGNKEAIDSLTKRVSVFSLPMRDGNRILQELPLSGDGGF